MIATITSLFAAAEFIFADDICDCRIFSAMHYITRSFAIITITPLCHVIEGYSPLLPCFADDIYRFRSTSYQPPPCRLLFAFILMMFYDGHFHDSQLMATIR